MSPLPIGVHLLFRRSITSNTRGQVYIFFFTLIIYLTFHAARKPISVVKPALHPNCTEVAIKENVSIVTENATFCMWRPFDTDDYNSLYGYLDLAYLLSYAFGMFASGHIAERMNLRIFLSVGCLLSALTTAAFGFGYFFNIHCLAFYIIVQIIGGLVQSSGWPAVVTCMGNWFGKQRRGFLLGLWNSHTSLGNILGGLLAGIFVEIAWGWSFVVPAIVLAFSGLLVFLFLIPYPEDLGLSMPNAKISADSSNSHLINTPSTSSEPDWSTSDELDPLLKATEPSEVTFSLRENNRAISFGSALRVPGVMEFALCLFFAKSVSYTFLFWLPVYIREVGHFQATVSADLSTIFDVGGILGGVVAGLVSDSTIAPAITCSVMLACAIPILFLFHIYGVVSVSSCVAILIPLGFFINGPYTLITTAVSADLGLHDSLRGNSKALATVTAIIDGTGSFGAAIGPLLCGLLIRYGWSNIFLMLTLFLSSAILLLVRRMLTEFSCCSSTPSLGYSSLSTQI